MRHKRFLILVILFFAFIVFGRSLDWEIEDSLRRLPPRMWRRWLKERGIEDDFHFIKPDSLNVRCVGRWSYGPSWEIMGKNIGNNTYLFLSRESGVSILRFIPPDSIELLSDINASRLVMD